MPNRLSPAKLRRSACFRRLTGVSVATFELHSARGYADSACQGYERKHAAVEVPYKRRKCGKLSAEEKEYNRGLGSFRVGIEHRIGRTKRFRIVAERFRNPRHTHHTKTSIVAGLVNIEAGFSLS